MTSKHCENLCAAIESAKPVRPPGRSARRLSLAGATVQEFIAHDETSRQMKRAVWIRGSGAFMGLVVDGVRLVGEGGLNLQPLQPITRVDDQKSYRSRYRSPCQEL